MMTDAEIKEHVQNELKTLSQSHLEGYFCEKVSAIGFVNWNEVKKERLQAGWEIRPYTEECRNFATFSAFFQKKI